MTNRDFNELFKGLLKGKEASLAQLITLIENNLSIAPEIIEQISSHLGHSFSLGVTGSAGVGKSTLIEKLVTFVRNDKLSIGILAVDPSSSISGGAFLGDRIRMKKHYLDIGVFIRSLATRGNRGGLSPTISIALKLLDAYGKDIIMVETTGVGQTDVGIKDIVDCVVVVLTPESGDSIQLMKAGLLEIADIIVVNKADIGDAEWLVSEIQNILLLSRKPKDRVSVVTCQATEGKGVDELYQEIRSKMIWRNSSAEKG